jgi:sporulation protein YlmC with PRC-barrel domain
MHFNDVRNRPVVSLADAERLGFVDDILIDTERSTVVGFVIRHGGIVTHHEAMLLTDVRAIGEDALTVADASKLNARKKFAELQAARTGSQLFGSRVLDESGSQIGKLADVDADFTSGAVQSWILSDNVLQRLRGEVHTVSVGAVKSIGDGLVVVHDNTPVA